MNRHSSRVESIYDLILQPSVLKNFAIRYARLQIGQNYMKEYEIKQIDGLIPLIQDLVLEIKTLYSRLFVLYGFRHETLICDKDIYRFYKENQAKQHAGVKMLRNSVSLLKLSSHPPLWDHLKESWGMVHPILEAQPILRCDLPFESSLRFLRHQDYPYNRGSTNSITVWIPLQDVDSELGALLVAPGTSQHNYPHQNGLIDSSIDFQWEQLPMRMGEVLSFSQRLVHESGVNNSRHSKIRFTAILRVSDYGNNNYIQRYTE